jgi:hypothetical protein
MPRLEPARLRDPNPRHDRYYTAFNTPDQALTWMTGWRTVLGASILVVTATDRLDEAKIAVPAAEPPRHLHLSWGTDRIDPAPAAVSTSKQDGRVEQILFLYQPAAHSSDGLRVALALVCGGAYGSWMPVNSTPGVSAL